MKSVKFVFQTLVIAVAASFTTVDDAVAQQTGAKNGNGKTVGTGLVENIAQPDGIVGQDGNIGLEEKDYVFLFGNVHRDTAVLRVLFQNAPNYFNAPDMPRFAIIGKERKFYLGIGGYVKGVMSFDIGNPIENATGFVTSSIPMNNPRGDGSLVQFSAASSNLFFNFVALPDTKNQIGAYVNFNFSGNNNDYGFSLKAAYITYRGFIFGYNSSLFTDGAAAAPTIDQQGPNAMTSVFNTVLDYQYTINRHWSVGAGLELPVVDATYNDYSYGINQRIPDIPFYVQYSWKNGSGWARMSGLVRNMFYRDNGEDDITVDKMGFGIKASGAVPLNSRITAFYQGVYGKGIASYIQDVQGYGLDMVPVASSFGRLHNVEAWGAYIGLQWQISSKFLTSATYSMVETRLPESVSSTFVPGVEYRHNNSFMPASTYKNAKYMVANLFYNITPTVTCGVEYLWGCRENVDGEFKQDNRMQTALRVNF